MNICFVIKDQITPVLYIIFLIDEIDLCNCRSEIHASVIGMKSKIRLSQIPRSAVRFIIMVWCFLCISER